MGNGGNHVDSNLQKHGRSFRLLATHLLLVFMGGCLESSCFCFFANWSICVVIARKGAPVEPWQATVDQRQPLGQVTPLIFLYLSIYPSIQLVELSINPSNRWNDLSLHPRTTSFQSIESSMHPTTIHPTGSARSHPPSILSTQNRIHPTSQLPSIYQVSLLQ